MISIHAPRTGSDKEYLKEYDKSRAISIHAPRTGSDGCASAAGSCHPTISIHAPRTGSDVQRTLLSQIRVKFQSTLPARGATNGASVLLMDSEFQSTLPARGATAVEQRTDLGAGYFNPRSPHGERQRFSNLSGMYKNFNPRSPHGERRLLYDRVDCAGEFQSTLPARGATCPRRK